MQCRIVDGNGNRPRIAVVMFYPRTLISFAADTICRGRPRKYRTHRAACLCKRSVCRIHIRQCLFNRTVVFECHLYAARKIHLHGLRRYRPREKADGGGQRESPQQSFGETFPIFQIHFLLARNGCTRTMGNSRDRQHIELVLTGSIIVSVPYIFFK